MSGSCDHDPFALLIGLAERLQAFFDQQAAQVGLTPGQAHALIRIEGPTRMGDLAEQQTCDPSTVTAMVQRLERDGYVHRVIDPNDARARLVQLTPHGERTRSRLVALVADSTSVIEELPSDRRAALAALFAPTTVGR
jgi:DNA-binding MarR family transcriptional regulator